MFVRAFLIAVLVLLVAPALAAVRPAPGLPAGPPMTFYLVKGAADACGPHCDRWIEAEGRIDDGAAARFSKFFSQLRDRSLPVYFASPGGNVDEALAMGAMLRNRSATARVARTVVDECGFEAQDSEICLKLKRSGRELHGGLVTRGAQCNSACPYLMLGATTREIAPDAVLGVHSVRVVTHYLGGVPTPERRAADTDRGMERAHRLISQYLKRMSADAGLLALASSVRYEDMHVLTRDEIARFGIDRREVVGLPWRFENAGRAKAYTTIVQKNADNSYRMLQWRLVCTGNEQFELDFQRPHLATTIIPAVVIYDGATPQRFVAISSQVTAIDYWGTRLNGLTVEALARRPQLDLNETSLEADGQWKTRVSSFSIEGLTSALDSLRATCPPTKTVTASSRNRTPNQSIPGPYIPSEHDLNAHAWKSLPSAAFPQPP